jgi:hypothetical protein
MTQPKITLNQLKQYLRNCDQEELITDANVAGKSSQIHLESVGDSTIHSARSFKVVYKVARKI